MKVSKRIITFFLALAMLFSLFSFASASSASGILVDSASVTAWNTLLSNNVKIGASVSDAQSEYWSLINSVLSRYGVGSLASYDKVVQVTSRLDSSGSGIFGSLIEVLSDGFTALWDTPDYIVMYDSSLGVYRPYDNDAHIWVVNSMGHFPYYDPDPDSGSDSENPVEPEVIRTGTWVEKSKVGTQTVLWHVASNYELMEFREQWSDLYSCSLVDAGNYYWLVRTSGYTAYVLCDKYGFPYYLPKDNESALTTDKNYYTSVGDSYVDDSTTNNYYDYSSNDYSSTDNSTNVSVYDNGTAVVGSPIDLDNGIVNIGGELQYIDNMVYDASTQTYYIDAHSEYIYNIDQDYYYTYNYSYKYEYYVDYTSITYIGQTEEYDERYEYYYELPDGRSSADLTVEDLEQLSLVFADVVNYARSADDLSQRVLYHFDGNTEDDSYWSYCTVFDWASGASLTYLDEGTFNGSLYLDETEHDFTITLPGTSDLSSDFTLQWRYYQSYTAAPQLDSYLQLGGDTVLQFTGSQYLTASGAAIAATSIGSWNELCLMKSDGVLYYYINGVCYGSVADNNFHSNTIRFYFGADQQTYKKIDELRFTKAAVYTPGVDYTPSSVPFDSNLSLVLPDGLIPVADEVMVFTPSENNLLTSIGLDVWTDFSVVDNLIQYNGYSYEDYLPTYNQFGIFYNSTVTSFLDNGGSVDLDASLLDFAKTYDAVVYPTYMVTNITGHYGGLFLPIFGGSGSSKNQANIPTSWISQWSNFDDGTYTFSVLMADGTSSRITFCVDSSSSAFVSVVSNVTESLVFLGLDSLGFAAGISTQWNHFRCYGISVLPSGLDVDTEIIYMELVEGSEPEFTISWEQAVYSSGELEDSPVLAVRTNQEITSYQIGGVRPSYPTKGLVYALVESGYITSLQIYTGTAWEEVDGRIWTGTRWVPYSYFNVLTLQDYYDSIGSSGDDYEYIYTESGFWAWLQKAWSKMLLKLDAIILALGGDPDAVPGDDSGDDSNLTFWQRVKKIFEESLAKIIESLLDLITRILDVVLGLVYDLLEFFSDLLSDVVVNGIGEFFAALTDEALLQFFHSEEPVLYANGDSVLNEDGDPVTTTVVALPAGVAGVFAFISATIMVLPDELRGVLFFGMSALLLLAVLKLIRA